MDEERLQEMASHRPDTTLPLLTIVRVSSTLSRICCCASIGKKKYLSKKDTSIFLGVSRAAGAVWANNIIFTDLIPRDDQCEGSSDA